MIQHRTYKDYILSSDYYRQAPYVIDTRLVGSDNTSVVQVHNNPAGQYPDPPVSDFTVQMLTKGAPYSKFELGAGEFAVQGRRGSFVVTPPDTHVDFQLESTFSADLIGIPKGLFDKANEAIGDANNFNLDVLHTRMFDDPFIKQLILRIMSEAYSNDRSSALFVDHAVNMLIASLFSLAGRIKVQKLEARALPDALVTRVQGLMSERLSHKVTLNELAQSVDLDVFHFTRAFRRATGQTPYQYLLEQRIARAREMLANTTEGLAAIAHDCGFSSQSHFTSTFSKHVGVSPGVYRNEVSV